MKDICFIFLFLFSSLSSSYAQLVGFEESVPQTFKVAGKGELKTSSLFYKEGKSSLEWDFQPGSTLDVQVSPLSLNAKKEQQFGITLWIYNEKPQQDSVRFEFLNEAGEVSYWFSYHLQAAGWRACWISFAYMNGNKKDKNIVGYRLVAPQREGRIFLDRLTFPEKKMNLRTTPDQQLPTNNGLSNRDLWHWCLVWKWEKQSYDIPLLSKLTSRQKKDLKTIEQRLTDFLDVKKAPQGQVNAAYKTFEKAAITPSAAGTGFTGMPVVAPDEQDKKKGEMSWNDIETMLAGFAYDACYNQNETSKKNYFTVFDYAIDQGFAFGSGMGTNHHYGYQIRKIYTTAWLMRNEIYKHPHRDAYLSALRFWAALQETRQPCSPGRDELLDSWHTLLMAKLISAMMFPDANRQEQALNGLSRWLSSSLRYTPGTIGGIKVDGTTFHHGGFYPGYTTGVLATIGQFIAFTNGTDFELTEEARQHIKSAFIAMRNYCNFYEWGIGISGRHPFGGKMGSEDIEAFANIALSGDLSGRGDAFDHGLAADYLRLIRNGDTPNARFFKKEGIQPAQAPQGFFVYNYGSAGIFRRADWMVTLKGYTTDVWGAEIYAKDNRYGRYQSYGSVQIMGKGNPVSRAGSGFVQEGWDWNRLPGTTTIHLPFELLDSPLKGTTMVRSEENFSGSSSLGGMNGMFAMKLMERDYDNFTSDFVARKSVFCFDNRMICLGTGITNSNADYPTETTLFQTKFNGKEPKADNDDYWLHDGYDNYYHVVDGTVRSQVADQESRHEKTREKTAGKFSSAWIEHGKAPKDGTYEYMVLIQPSAAELDELQKTPAYEVLQRDQMAHVVYDKKTGITGYAAFEAYQPVNDQFIVSIPAETMVMYGKESDNRIRLSVCDPNLNLAEKTYTTKEPSRPISKKIVVKGIWMLPSPQEGIQLEYEGNNTLLNVTCQHGQPVEMLLTNK
ncbi:chondroitinase family polysaccharide lyase [Bacteroides faecis]|uniref:chondroitinase family polysaccharide lyase n=1 Tax=Bacteroides faecis TaxID=674529 RepID=UPI001020B0E6|nr:chondroitinase family polysaccharide lyase [Bacteroides faecis]KAA5269035.1 chondroitinase [Bacteroides faecis]MCE9008533.1 chondroitinase [Bacteroides faecis]RYT87623.1 chondroitinase [Bacteroides faecis]